MKCWAASVESCEHGRVVKFVVSDCAGLVILRWSSCAGLVALV